MSDYPLVKKLTPPPRQFNYWDDSAYRNWARYEELGLPNRWIDSCRKSPLSWPAPDNYFWIEDHYFHLNGKKDRDLIDEIREKTGGSFLRLSLEEQCALLQIRLKSCASEKINDAHKRHSNIGRKTGTISIENFALNLPLRSGWSGKDDEGELVYSICKGISEHFTNRGFKYWKTPKDDPWKRYPVKLSSRHHAAAQEIAASLVVSDVITARKNEPDVMQFTCSDDDLVSFFDALDILAIYGMACATILGFPRGSADLTIWKGGEIRFVEVKSETDKLRLSQASWIWHAKPIIGIPYEIWRIDRRANSQYVDDLLAH